MPSEAIATKFQKRFDELNTALRSDRKEIVSLQKKLHTIFARTLRPLRDMEGHFRSKPPDMKFSDGNTEYQNFDQWLAEYIEPFTGYKKRQAYYALHMAKHLVDKVTDEDLESVGIEKAKELSRYAESKGRVPKELVEKAKTSTTKALHDHVQQAIYKGNSDHEERAAWDTLEITGPRPHTAKIRNFLQLLRRQEGHKPSDAELLSDVIAVDYEELANAEERRRAEISGLPPSTLGRSQ